VHSHVSLHAMLSGLLLVTISAVAANDVYNFGPCNGPDPSGKFDTEVNGEVSASTGAIEWWPTLRPEDIYHSDKKTTDLTASCGPTGDFGFGCNFDKLECRSNFQAIYEMCSAGMFKRCVNNTATTVVNNEAEEDIDGVMSHDTLEHGVAYGRRRKQCVPSGECALTDNQCCSTAWDMSASCTTSKGKSGYTCTGQCAAAGTCVLNKGRCCSNMSRKPSQGECPLHGRAVQVCTNATKEIVV